VVSQRDTAAMIKIKFERKKIGSFGWD